MKSLLISFLFLVSCSTDRQEKKSTTIEGPEILDKDSIIKTIEESILNNDTALYDEISHYYLFNNMSNEFLLYAIKMANKNNYSRSYFDIYEIIARSTPYDPEKSLKLLDKKTRDFALYNLWKSNKLGYPEAKKEINKFFKNYNFQQITDIMKMKR